MVFAGFICVCFGGCTVQRDLRLVAFGQDTTAEIMLLRREQYDGEKHSHAAVEFAFHDQNGKRHIGRDRVSVDWERPMDSVITVTYLPNSPNISELRGNWHAYHWIIFITGMGLMGGTYVTDRGIRFRAA